MAEKKKYLDPTQVLLNEINNTKITKGFRWPNIDTTSEHHIVVGTANNNLKRYCELKKQTEIKIKKLQKTLLETPCCQEQEMEDLQKIISSLKDKIENVSYFMMIALKSDFPDSLMEKAIIGIGRKGKVFYLNVSDTGMFSSGFMYLVNNIPKK